MFRSLLLVTLPLGVLLSLTGCTNLNDPYYPNNGYDRGYGYRYPDSRDYRYDRERDRIRDERDDLRDQQRDLERERERLERERRRHEAQQQRPAYTPPPPPKRETCPSGWRPGRCSNKDRKHGCKDKRLPGGLGCRTN